MVKEHGLHRQDVDAVTSEHQRLTQLAWRGQLGGITASGNMGRLEWIEFVVWVDSGTKGFEVTQKTSLGVLRTSDQCQPVVNTMATKQDPRPKIQWGMIHQVSTTVPRC